VRLLYVTGSGNQIDDFRFESEADTELLSWGAVKAMYLE
jgi:hypothetical protein